MKSFEQLLTPQEQALDHEFWTDDQHLNQIATWLENCNHIVDLGSGIGKFCFKASTLINASFTGFELRSNLYKRSLTINLALSRSITFKNTDFLKEDLSPFDGIYFFNPFVESISLSSKIDTQIKSSEKDYYQFHQQLQQQLEHLPSETKLVINSPYTDFVPSTFTLEDQEESLTLWIKTD
ncbi:class I SAM-dependent methyltransferase [Cyclobacteriaceae bacterium]|nr:class I SAM-dependent methyltransferase [Cyclobacteriaceae bacterium]